MSGASIDIDILKDIPGYRGILKAVLRYQIQLLVEQLCKHGGEESVVLSANVTEGTLSHLGTDAGKGFLTDNNEVKRQYLGYCLKNYQKRKSEFMSPSTSSESIQPTKFVSSKPEPVVNYPVHRKPYFRVQRRNTRLRSGGKQFSSFYTKTGLNRPTLQKIATQGAYKEMVENVPQNQGQFSSQFIGPIESPRQHETLNTQYTELSLDDQSHRTDIGVKIENTTDERNSSESEVTVKVEPLEETDETGSKASTEMSEDIQALDAGRLGHHFSPNVSMETEDSFSEGNQSFEYVLDNENANNAMSPWKPDETEKVSLFSSKRKQALPTRIKKSSEKISERNELVGQFSPSTAWSHDQMHSLSADEGTSAGGSPYSEGAVDMSWGEESQHSGVSKTYMKTPQIVGLFVSRGEGRYEKLIKCEDCGKVCRTSNMARHKKRYCTTSPSAPSSRTRKNYAQAIKELSNNSPKPDVYLDNQEKETYPMDPVGSSVGSLNSSQTEIFGVRKTDSGEVFPNEDFINKRNDTGACVVTSDSSFDGDDNLHKSITIKQEPSNPDMI